MFIFSSLFLVFIFFISTAESSDSLLFRIHGQLFIRLDFCYPLNSDFYPQPYGILTKSGEEITFKQCQKANCESESCDEISVKITLKKFEPFPYVEGIISPIGTRVVDLDSKANLADNDFGMVMFNDQTSCENLDYSNAYGVVYPGKHTAIMECANTGVFSPTGKSSSKCKCDEEKHILSCRDYNMTNNCEGQFREESESCSDTDFTRRVCGDVDLSKMGSGILVDLSTDIYAEAGTRKPDNDTCSVVEIESGKYMQEENCDFDCKSNCQTLFHQDLKDEEDVAVETVLFSFFNPFGAYVYEYGTEKLKIEAGSKNENGYFDVVYESTEEGFKNAAMYGYSLPSFEWCNKEHGTMWICGSDGKITVQTFEIKESCTGNMTSEIKKDYTCGKLPHYTGDLESGLSTGEILGIIFGSVGTVALCCCSCCCLVICCIFWVVVLIFIILMCCGGTGSLAMMMGKKGKGITQEEYVSIMT